MRRLLAKVLTTLCIAAGGIALASGSAAADVVSPPGACTASGHFVHAGFTKKSTGYVSSDVVVVPQKDDVRWVGHELGKPIGYVGPKRPINGAIQIELPGSFGVSIWHWGGEKSPRYSNQGEESYSLPSILIGVRLKLTGFEEDNGKTICSGSVYVQVAGSRLKNPLGWVGLGGSVLFLAGLVFAGFRKIRPAYDDINP